MKALHLESLLAKNMLLKGRKIKILLRYYLTNISDKAQRN